MLKLHAMLAGLLLTFAIPAGAAVDLLEELQKVANPPLPVRDTEGVIERIDLAERSAIIGGYTYYFGPPDLQIPLKVRVIGSEFGSIEMLKTGMKVRMLYGDTGNIRIGLDIQVLPDDAVLADH